MKIKCVLRDAAIMALALFGLQMLQASLLKDALTQLDRMAARRLESSVAGILNKAHKDKDDIAIVQVLEALNQAPGVVQAHLLGPEGKSVSGPRMYSYPLKDGQKKWGCLSLTVSDHLRRQLVSRQWLMGTASTACIWTLFFLYMQLLARRDSALQKQRDELRGMLQAAERKYQALREHEQLTAAQTSVCLRRAVEQIPVPVIILDAQQRVAAINAASLSCAGLSRAEDVLLKSWHEIPLLQSCGALLEQSLQSPIVEIQGCNPLDGLRLTLTTLKEGSGTWVTLFPSSHVVK